MGEAARERSTAYSLFVGVVLAVLMAPWTVLAGNGADCGSHYSLNLIGVPKGKSAEMSGNNGRRIFVPLEGKTQIGLRPSADGQFRVLDANGTDGKATFELPPPYTSSGVLVYHV